MLLSERKNQIRRRSLECLEKAKKTFKSCDRLNNISVDFDFSLKGQTAGQARFKGNGSVILRYNTELIENSHFNDLLENTVPHEVAHIVTRYVYPLSKPHGYEWRKVMMCVFGIMNPRATHNYKVTKARKTKKYKYICPHGCEAEVGPTVHKKISILGKTYRCTKHREKITYTGKMSYK